MSAPAYPPDYCDAETLAYRLSVAVGCVDQMVRRGEIPAPYEYSGAVRWKWAEVEQCVARLRTASGTVSMDGSDPITRGIDNAPLPSRLSAVTRASRNLART